MEGKTPRPHKAYNRLSPEQRKEVYMMYKSGANQYELGEMFDVSQRTVSSIIREESIRDQGYPYDRVHVGGKTSKSIDISTSIPEKRKSAVESSVIENQAIASSVVVSRQVVVRGLGTGFEYLVSSDQDFIEIKTDAFQIQIQAEKLQDFILELQGVQRNAGKVVKGCEAW